jgi:hypothetical protein
MEEYNRRIKTSLQLFDRLNCCSGKLKGIFDDVDAALRLVDVEKIRYLIINCLIALHLVQKEKSNTREDSDEENYEVVKSRVFNAAVSMITSHEFKRDEAFVETILSSFPDEKEKSVERSWLPEHFTIALAMRNKISEGDIRIMLSIDPSAVHTLRREAVRSESEISLMVGIAANTSRFRDLETPVLCDEGGRCPLHLVAQYSVSFELLEDILQIDHKMTKLATGEEGPTPLGLLCSRPYSETLNRMFLYLIAVNCTVEVIYDGIIHCMRSHKECTSHDISPGLNGLKILTFITWLLQANRAVKKYNNSRIFHSACIHLRGELGISILSLMLRKDSTALKAINEENLPIHNAAIFSCLDVVKFLLEAYPESISMLGYKARSLLHLAATDQTNDIAVMKAKVQYLCDQCPALIHLNDIDGDTVLHTILKTSDRFNFECVKILCNVDATVVRDKHTPFWIPTIKSSGQLPLHGLIWRSKFREVPEVSDEADCFRLFLRLYPAAAGIKEGSSRSLYDLAVSDNWNSYFIRLLLSADPTINPIRRHNLNFAARRQGMFLAFRALSSDKKPTIWAKMRLKGRDLLEHVISYL